MAAELTYLGGNPTVYIAKFVCDFIADIDNLPTTTEEGKGEFDTIKAVPMSSMVYCKENDSTYDLFSNGWTIRV